MGWLKKGREVKGPPDPEPLSELAKEMSQAGFHLATSLGWHCAEILTHPIGDPNKKSKKTGVILSITGRPKGASDDITHDFFFHHDEVQILVETVLKMAMHTVMHQHGGYEHE